MAHTDQDGSSWPNQAVVKTARTGQDDPSWPYQATIRPSFQDDSYWQDGPSWHTRTKSGCLSKTALTSHTNPKEGCDDRSDKHCLILLASCCVENGIRFDFASTMVAFLLIPMWNDCVEIQVTDFSRSQL
ncbi:hypothetical protein E3N88_33512 [Mikania micrantha]|uniref:Uncharacterized protein n=1 Tax=Mikania micrantha TaxID=192012 RepID=A0A5N6MCU5_9ASTR|nr:hypothetical protein E3N88_33512 [Mikania micrantha]